jgi:hypothetical protein
MQSQVAQVAAMLEQASESNIPWIMGGVFNLLPPGHYDQLPESKKIYY